MKVLIVTAMYPTPDNPAFGAFVKTQADALRQAGVDVELFVLNGRSRKLMYLKALFQLRRRVADTEDAIDVIHAQFSYPGIIARMQSKVPVVVTFHGDDLLGTVKDATGEQTWDSPLIVRAGQWLGRVADASIVVNAQMAARLGVKENVYIIPGEVELGQFAPMDRDQARAKLGLDRHKKYVLFAANPNIPVKNFAFAQRVFRRLHQHDPNVELCITYKESQERLALYFNACDALLFTSFQEGSPTVVKQAMACNLPIVATDVGDVRAVIGQTDGCRVCPTDVDAFIEALSPLLAQPGRTTGQEQMARFSPPTVASQVIGVYQDTLQRQTLAVSSQSSQSSQPSPASQCAQLPLSERG